MIVAFFWVTIIRRQAASLVLQQDPPHPEGKGRALLVEWLRCLFLLFQHDCHPMSHFGVIQVWKKSTCALTLWMSSCATQNAQPERRYNLRQWRGARVARDAQCCVRLLRNL